MTKMACALLSVLISVVAFDSTSSNGGIDDIFEDRDGGLD